MSIFARTHTLDCGSRVRLRLARPGDAAAVAQLLASRGLDSSPLDIRRVLTFDPRCRTVVCAFALVDGMERLVGLAAADLEEGAEPDTLVVDERLTDGLGALLGCVLAEKAAYRTRRVA